MFLSAAGVVSLFLWALRDAAREGNLVKVVDLVNDGVSVHAHQYLDRRSPLHEACRYGHLEVVKYLLEKTDASVGATEKYSLSTPLHEACIGGHTAVVDYLVSVGKADLYYQDSSKQTALHKASAAGHVNLCRYLITNGEKGQPGTRMVDTRDKNERTPLHIAAQSGHLDVVDFLVKEARARIHDQSITGDTPLHYACVNDHAPVVKFLLDCRARLDIANREGLTPVDSARLSNSAAVVMCLDQWESGDMPVVIEDVSSNHPDAAIPPQESKPPPVMSDPALPNGEATHVVPDVAQYSTEDKIAGMQGTTPISETPFYSEQPPPTPQVSTETLPPSSEPVVAAPQPVQAEVISVPQPETAQTGGATSVKSRLARLEERFALASKGGSIQDRLAALETEVLGNVQSGTVNARLSKLEFELVDWQRVVALEATLEIVPRKEGSIFERIADLELELMGESSSDSITTRLGRLETAVTDWSRVLRLENELGLSSSQQGSRQIRIAAIEQEIFGETRGGTTIASRLSNIEAELFGS